MFLFYRTIDLWSSSSQFFLYLLMEALCDMFCWWNVLKIYYYSIQTKPLYVKTTSLIQFLKKYCAISWRRTEAEPRFCTDSLFKYFLQGIFRIFLYLLYSTLLHLPPLFTVSEDAWIEPRTRSYKKMMSPCSIWQGVWASAQEIRYLCEHKRGN